MSGKLKEVETIDWKRDQMFSFLFLQRLFSRADSILWGPGCPHMLRRTMKFCHPAVPLSSTFLTVSPCLLSIIPPFPKILFFQLLRLLSLLLSLHNAIQKICPQTFYSPLSLPHFTFTILLAGLSLSPEFLEDVIYLSFTLLITLKLMTHFKPILYLS